ncbi:MAG: XTP/dITP diphosphatase [Desulfurococcales archaeon]|nr:XTP/dITP diphosphatase [Desulfurococcales archaeon]
MVGSRRFYLVTRNRSKYLEAVDAIAGYSVELEMLPMDKEELQSDDLSDIALHAARVAYYRAKKPVVVDDSGLFVKALNGFPGPYSSYVYKTIGIRGLLKLLEDSHDRSACFKTALAVIDPPLEEVYWGEVCGTIAVEPRGTGGFGFDPVFIPNGSSKTFAEMDRAEKNRYSHRARAFRAFAEAYSS